MKKRIIAAAIVAATTMPIKAAIITQEVSFGEQGSPFDVADVSPLSESVFIDAFDQTLGTLNAVNIMVYGQIDSEGRSVNGSSEPGRTDVNIFLASNWQVSSSVADTFIFEPANFINPLVSAQSSPEGTFTMIPGEDSADARTNVFNQVEGGSGSFTNEFSTGSWGKVFVEFDYSPTATSVSEPAAFSLFGAGLFFLLSNRRKALKK